MRIYYLIWADAIAFERKNQKKLNNKGGFMFFTLVPMSGIQGINLFGVFLLMNSFGFKIDPFINFNLFQFELLNKVLSSFITLYFPFLVINYFLVFRKKIYQNTKKV